MSIVGSHKRSEKRFQGDEGKALSQSVHANRVRLKAGGQYLHWSGDFLTDNPKHAWSGTPEQADACQRKFSAAAGCKMVEA